jgi:lysozyme
MIASIEDQLRRDEGVRLNLYQDTRGKWTIGVGRNLSDVGISMAEANTLLSNDILAASNALERAFPWTTALDSVRFFVLVNMTFNMGIGALAGFKDFLNKVQQGDFRAAAGAMLDSAWAREVGPRAQRLSIQMEGGQWQ